MKAKKQESLLDNLYLASPCSIPWESMEGDDRERSCSGCSRTIYNISDMSRREAEAFLRKNGTSECMKFYRRADGTVMTDDCPRALRKIRDRCKLAVKIAAGVVAFVVSLPAAIAQSVQTGDTSVLNNNVQQLMAPDISQPHGMANGNFTLPPRLMGKTMAPQVTPPTTTPTTTTPRSVSVEGRIVTKKHTLPNGKHVLLVEPGKDGKIVRVGQPKKDSKKNPLLDTRASDFYSLAEKARADNKLDLAEFYFEKALEMADLQKNGDAEYRKHIETELNNLRSRTSGSKDKSRGSE